MYFKILLFIHILGAIAGLGPTFTFSYLGARAKKEGGPVAVALMESIHGITKAFVIPGAIVQGVSGVLLLVETGRHRNLFDHEWLWIGIVLYIVLVLVGNVVTGPALKRMIGMAKSGKAGQPEFVASAKRVAAAGPLSGLLLLSIIFLMVVKPGV